MGALLYRVPMHVRRATAVHQTAKRTRGLPPGLDRHTLETVVREHLGSDVVDVSHEHLSNWKPTGAYRLIIESSTRKLATLIFKNADYSLDSVPAQEELPVTIGAPEYAVMSTMREPLQTFVPEVYWTDDVAGEQRFRYLMEDLHWRWYRPIRGPDIRATARAMPRLHTALREVVDPHSPGLIDYDEGYSAGLRVYVTENVERYLEIHPDEDAARLWESWPMLESAHVERAPDDSLGGKLIHGDFNIANLYLHWRRRDRLKAVDWEWCGRGFPHTDLASVLKHASTDAVEAAVNEYAAEHPAITLEEHVRAYAWCRLQDAIRDAGYVAAQFTDFEHRPRVEPSVYLARTLRRARSAVEMLQRNGMR